MGSTPILHMIIPRGPMSGSCIRIEGGKEGRKERREKGREARGRQ